MMLRLLIFAFFMISFSFETSFARDEKLTESDLISQMILNIHQNPGLFDDFILQQIPPFYGHDDFLKVVNENDSEKFENENKNEKLISKAIKGEEFKNSYLSQLREGVSVESYNYLLRFDSHALERIYVLMGMNAQERRQRNMTSQEAEKLALYSTATRFGLSTQITAPQLTAMRFESDLYDAAYLYYQREFYKALVMIEVPGSTRQPWDLKRIKDQIVQEIQKARVENFLSAMKYAAEKNKIEFKVLDSTGKLIVDSDSNVESIRFENEVVKSDSLYPKRSFSKRIDKFFGYYSLSKRKRDHDVAQDFYIPRSYSPKWSKGSVEVTWRSGAKAKISEQDFSKWLNLLRPNDVLDLFSGDVFRKRFLIEASKRDSLLADLEDVILDQNDLSQLIKTLNDRLILFENLSSENRYSITENIRSEKNSLEDHFFNNLRWSGWAVHPDFWRLRSKIAKESGHPAFLSIGSEQIIERTKDEVKKYSKLQKNEKGLNKHRLSSRSKRRALLLAPFVIWTGLGASAVLGTMQVFDHFLSPLSGIDIGLTKGGAQNKNYWSMNDDDRHYIVSQEIANKKGPLVFKISPLSLNAEKNIPEYFNIADNGNLPKDVLLDDSRYDEPNSVRRLRVIDEVDPNADFRVESFLLMDGSNNRYGILSLPGYVITSLKIKTDEKYLDEYSYQVYEVPNSRLTYIETFRDINITGYTAYYKKDNRKIYTDESFDRLDRHAMNSIAEELSRLGAEELGGNLNHLLSSKKNISLEQIDQTFASSGFYTYREVGKGNSKSSDLLKFMSSFFSKTESSTVNLFDEYKRYLLNGSFYYQCSASNSLLIDTLNSYATQADAPFTAMAVHGYRNSGESVIFANQGHRHTLVTHNYKHDTFKYLDATPLEMDPANDKQTTTQKEEEQKTENHEATKDKKSDEDKSIESIGVLTRNYQRGDRQKNDNNKNSNDNENEQRKMLYRERSIEQIKTMIKLLSDVAEKEAQTNGFFKKQVSLLANQPGLNVLGYATIVQELLEQKINPKLALKILVAKQNGFRDLHLIGSNSNHPQIEQIRNLTESTLQNHGSVNGAIVSVLKENHKKTQDLFERISSEIMRTGQSELSFMLASDWKTNITSLFQLILKLDYTLLTGEPAVTKSTNSCELYLEAI